MTAKRPDTDSTDPMAGRVKQWVDASAGVQRTAKWVITAFAAVGAVMFAKGFVTTPKLSWSEHAGQLIGAWALGFVGILGIGWLIYLVSRLLLPTVYTLNSLPKPFVELVEKAPRDYLPSGSQSIQEFHDWILTYSKGLDQAKGRLSTAQAELLAARAARPRAAARISAAETEVMEARETATLLQRNVNLYLQSRHELLDRAAYWSRATAYSLNLPLVCVAAAVAALGGIGYQLALSAPDQEAKASSASPGPSLPAVGQLIRSDTDAGRELWGQLHLDLCQVVGDAVVPVVVESGSGTSDDPYHVTTVGTGSCTPQSFTVVNEVARVSLPPTPAAITYTEAPPKSSIDNGLNPSPLFSTSG